MSAPNFLPLDPENAHGCFHCQRVIFDMAIDAYRCRHLGIVISKCDYVAPNDCQDFHTEWNNDLYKFTGKNLKP